VTRYKLAFAAAKYLKFGGMQRRLLRIARECARRGHDVHLFTGYFQGERPPEVAVHVLPLRALTNHGRYREFAQKLGSAVGGNAFDCVIGLIKIPGLDVYYGGDPCYVAKVDANKSRVYKLLPRYQGLKRLEEAVFAGDSDTEILLIAHEERDKFISYYGTDPRRFHLLPPGIDRERLVKGMPTPEAKSDLRRDLGLMSDDYMLLHVGSWFARKGVDRAMAALAALPEELRTKSKLVVVGDDKVEPFIRLARSLGVVDQVCFRGATEDIARFYYTADLLIHPAYTETAGATLIEAMVCGLPVLVTDNCGFAFHVSNARAGIVCPTPFQQDGLNRALVEMLNPERLSEWSRNACNYCETTDLYSLIEKAADVIVARAGKNRGNQ
jgi:UDP-glucose:(heptosyl)LPS alpha-1,3-glucosyltransferase